MKFYKIINDSAYVLLAKEEKSAKLVLGYGGVWGKDHRKAKRFKTIKDCQIEVEKMPYPKGTKFLIVSNKEDWKKTYRQFFQKLKKSPAR